jgi:hypothetical protein
MKTPKRKFAPWCLAVLALAPFGTPARALDDKPQVLEKLVVSEDAKTHTLFMGADIAITIDKNPYPVKSVIGSDWVIDVNGHDRYVATKGSPLDLRITPSLKLTQTNVQIASFVKAPSYSFANDPSVRLTHGLDQAAMQNAMLTGIAQDAEHLADTASNNALGPMAALATSDKQFGANVEMLTAQTANAAAHPPAAIPGSSSPPSNPNVSTTLGGLDGQALAVHLDVGAAANAEANTIGAAEPTSRLATMGYDAMDVRFDVSCAKSLREPYVVTLTRFKTPDSAGLVKTLVYAKALDPIDARPTEVHFVEEGFPFNYDLVDFQLHLYDHGVEVATSVSAKRVELTREEAFEYVKIEYMGLHKHDTLGASPAMGRLPADLHTQIALGKYAETFYVKVSKDGLGGESYTDMFCTQRIIDPYLDAVIKNLRFKPALSEGKAVDGVSPVNLSKLEF